jgi:hypothetical protein
MDLSDMTLLAPGPHWTRCDAGYVFLDDPAPSIALKNSTFFSFNHTSNTLLLKQTWYCGDLGESDEYKFTAIGSVSPALDQTSGYLGNTSIPQASAASPSLAVLDTKVHQQHLPPSTLETPQAFGYSCTVTSLLGPPEYYRVTGLSCETTASASKILHAQVTNEYFIDGYDGYPRRQLSAECYSQNGSEPWASVAGFPLYNCSLAWDAATNALDVRLSWVCADQDNEHP